MHEGFSFVSVDPLACPTCHGVLASARTTDQERAVLTAVHDASDQSIEFGPTLADPSITSTPHTGFVTLSATLGQQSAF